MRTIRVALPLVVVLLSAGCSARPGPPAPSQADQERARSALVAALDAWKKGEAAALTRHVPPIRFVDQDFAAGLRLADYELEEPDAPILPYQNVPVILSMRDPRGRTVRRETHYQVATEPALAVLRGDPCRVVDESRTRADQDKTLK